MAGPVHPPTSNGGYMTWMESLKLPLDVYRDRTLRTNLVTTGVVPNKSENGHVPRCMVARPCSRGSLEL